MRASNDLTIRGSRAQLLRRLDDPDRPLIDGWQRGIRTTVAVRGWAQTEGSYRHFECDAREGRVAAAVYLESDGPDGLRVANIAPRVRRAISDEECDAVLLDFYDRVIVPAAEGLDLEVRIAPERLKPEVYLSPEGLRRLKAFSGHADKSELDDRDRLRWRDFVLQSHLEQAALDPDFLGAWLAEQGWREDLRAELVGEYERTRIVLDAYDSERLQKCLP